MGATMQKQALSYKSNNDSWYTSEVFIHTKNSFNINISVLSIIYTSPKVNDRSKKIWNRLKPQKMNILLGVFPFKLSKDQKGIMICLG